MRTFSIFRVASFPSEFWIKKDKKTESLLLYAKYHLCLSINGLLVLTCDCLNRVVAELYVDTVSPPPSPQKYGKFLGVFGEDI